MSTRRDAVRQALALSSLGAGAIHVALGPEHMTEWAVLGIGFYVSGFLQLAWGARLMVTESRRLMAFGAFQSVLYVGVWLMSRTTGLPLGPERWQAEATGRADLLCVALESVIALGALYLLRRPTAGRAPAGRLAVRSVLTGVALAVLATTGVAVAAPSHLHEGGACPAKPVLTGTDNNHNGADDGDEAYFRCLLIHEHDDHKGYNQP
ncbi:MAG: hypothetical protein ABI336_05975 [Humibacillus sp.]